LRKNEHLQQGLNARSKLLHCMIACCIDVRRVEAAFARNIEKIIAEWLCCSR
jgi:hypothetical protein